MLRCVLCIVIIILEYCSAVRRDPRRFKRANATRDVHIDTGVVRGFLANNGEGSYYSFLGIPYAAPMTSRSRYKAPLPRGPWKSRGILLANRTVLCPQKELKQASEDCLVVNVFTPIAKTYKLTPVLVYIHGGGHAFGIPVVNVAPFIQQNIIVVTIIYRLGILGFLCLGLDEAPGNAGLKDQTAALRWVQKNIRNFGGDPTQVTLYGMSSGAACAELHVLSKMSTGLFRRAVFDGASSLPVWVTNVDPIDTALDFVEIYLQIPRQITKDLNYLVSYLQKKSAYTMGKHSFQNTLRLTDGTFGISPCVERQLNGTETFISKFPHEILIKQEYTKVPIMLIFASTECLNFKNQFYHDYKQRMEANFQNFLPADLIFDRDEVKEEVRKSIKSFYFGTKTVGDESNKIQYLKYFGDYLVVHGVLTSAEMHARGGNPVYLMEFAYKGNLGHHDQIFRSINTSKTAHVDFTQHVFASKVLPHDRQAVERAVKLIANFVKFGDPTLVPTPLLPVVWPRVQPGNVTYLRMGQEFTVHSLKDSPYWDRKVFWDAVYDKYRRRIQPVDPKKVRDHT